MGSGGSDDDPPPATAGWEGDLVSLPPRRPPVGPAGAARTPTASDGRESGDRPQPAARAPGTGRPAPPPDDVHARPVDAPPPAPATQTGHDPSVVSDPASEGPPGPTGDHTLRAGELLAQRYQLLSLLGRGAMGEVWKARHLLLQGDRAIKVITPALSRDPDFRTRFLREGQTMMKIRHRGVVEVTDLDARRRNGQLFMAMECLTGRTLAEAVRDPASPLAADPREAARVLREVALGMQRIHDEGVVHKDLKSENVFLVTGEDGLAQPKVIDFGLAKQVRDADPSAGGGPTGEDLATTLSGTLAYMAPELFHARPSTFASDVYAFGVMAYETFTGGEFPLPRGAACDYFQAHVNGQEADRLATARPSLDRELARILDACLAREPAERPASFREVAASLQRWLEAPERRRRRNRVFASVAGAAACISAAVYGVFFAGRTASLGALEVSSVGEEFPVRSDRRVHLPGRVLASIGLAASLEGEPGTPVLEVDGVRRPLSVRRGPGRLSAETDLSDLPDGEHVVALRADADAAPSAVRIVVDRAPPGPVRVRIDGSPDDRTNREAPVLSVEVDEAPERIGGVTAVVEGRDVPARPPVGGVGPWTVAGTAERDGPVELSIRVTDLAGNASNTTHRYFRDVLPPRFAVEDLVHAEDRGPEVRVRRPLGSVLRVRVDEPGVASAAVGDAPSVEVRADGGATAEFPLPAVPAAGLPVRLVVRDLARNERSLDLRVRAVDDVVSLTSSSGAKELAVRRDANVRVVVERAYPRDEPPSLVARRVLDAASAPVDEPPVGVPGDVVAAADGGLRSEVLLRAGALAPGRWLLSAQEPSGSRTDPLGVIVDSDPPEVCDVRVLDSAGSPPNAAGWVGTRDVIVDVEVSDLSLRRIELGGAAPEERPRPGRHVYRFRRACDHEGSTTWTLGLLDAAGNPSERSVTVRADWTVPDLSVAAPAPGADLDDVRLTEFTGRCSEAPFVLRIDGPHGPLEPGRRIDTPEFTHGVQLPSGDSVEVRVVATDLAGRESPPWRAALRVRRVETELPAEIVWTRDVSARMRRIDAGDVVFGGRAHAVRRAFIDRTEVTNGQYRAFLAATREGGGHGAHCHPDEPKGWTHEPPASTWADPRWSEDGLPVVNVAWWDAWAFARWSGRRLPTEAEWVRAAAKAADEEDLRRWPPFRGGEWRDGVLATSELTRGTGPVPADSGADVSPAGCLHMGGNASEWVEVPGGAAGVRGGNWFLTRAAADVPGVPARIAERSFRARTIGFRCAADPEGGRR